MTRLSLIFALLAAPLTLASAQLGNLSAPPPPKAYVAYTALPQTIAANHSATLELHFRVLPGYHVNSHKPTLDYLIPTALTVPAAAGLKPGEPAYPTGQPYSFAPMSSRERRMLHLAFRSYDDIETSSTGEGLRRFVVAHPKGYDTTKLAALASQSYAGARGGRHR